jgi:hypothetical protein
MATGSQAASYMRNLPPVGSFRVDPASFFGMTERNDLPLEARAFPGFGAFFEQRLSNIGILAGILLIFDGTLTTTGGTVTIAPTHRWPYGLLSSIQINANGQNNLLAIDGMDAKVRERRVYRNPPDVLDVAPVSASAAPLNAAGSSAVRLAWTLPIAHDETTLLGSIFAQSDESYLSMRLSMANQPAGASGDLFTVTAGSVALTGTFYPLLTFYEIPMVAGEKGGTLVVLPDLSLLHGMVAVNQVIAAAGDVTGTLLRTAGQLLCVYNRFDNGPTAIDPYGSALTNYRLRYGGNQIPREMRASQNLNALAYINQRDYDGPLGAGVAQPPSAAHPWNHLTASPRYLLLDLEASNPMRDVILPKGVMDLQQIFTIAAGTTINAGAQVHQVEEILFGGA